jgi:hypothetical protein
MLKKEYGYNLFGGTTGFAVAIVGLFTFLTSAFLMVEYSFKLFEMTKERELFVDGKHAGIGDGGQSNFRVRGST